MGYSMRQLVQSVHKTFCLKKKVYVLKGEGELRNCSILKENEETLKLNVICELLLRIGLGDKTYCSRQNNDPSRISML